MPPSTPTPKEKNQRTIAAQNKREEARRKKAEQMKLAKNKAKKSGHTK